MPYPKGLQWNQLQLKIAYALKVQKKTPKEIAEILGTSLPTIQKVHLAMKHGEQPPTLDPLEIAKYPMPHLVGKVAELAPQYAKHKQVTPNNTDKDGNGNQQQTELTAEQKKKIVSMLKPSPDGAVTDTSLLKLVAQVQQIPMTPNMYVSYFCALGHGFEGDFGAWLSLVCYDFWACRGINMFEALAVQNPYAEVNNGVAA